LTLLEAKAPKLLRGTDSPVVVVVAANEFKKLRAPRETPLAFFSRFKGFGLDLVRRKDLPRKIEV
jgi:hypothetical protein